MDLIFFMLSSIIIYVIGVGIGYKCGNESNNTIAYTEKDIICMDCYCELIAKKDRRLKCEQGQ